MKAYWPEAKMIGCHKDVVVYDSKGNAHLVEVEREKHATPKAIVHYDGAHYLGRDIACGFVPQRAVTTSEDPKLVTCRACIAHVRILFGDQK